MDWKKLGKALLFPHIAVMIILVPVATAFLVCSMVFLGTESVIAIVSYVLAAYTLTVWCVKIPYLIDFFKTFKNENKYVLIWRSNPRLRVNVSLFASLIWNTVYALFQIWLGFLHHTFWFYLFGGYYICLALMRFFLVRHTIKYAAGEKMQTELVKYRACGWIFLAINVMLALIVFFMVYWDRSFNHGEITTIVMATYTFTFFAVAIVNIVKYRKYNSPAYLASKAISLAAACVSVLTLESTMLTTFGDGTMSALTRKIMIGATGGVISAFVIAMAIYMIVGSTKELKEIAKGSRNH